MTAQNYLSHRITPDKFLSVVHPNYARQSSAQKVKHHAMEPRNALINRVSNPDLKYNKGISYKVTKEFDATLQRATAIVPLCCDQATPLSRHPHPSSRDAEESSSQPPPCAPHLSNERASAPPDKTSDAHIGQE